MIGTDSSYGVRKAEYIVEQLLEDNLNGRTLVFGPQQGPLGFAYKNVDVAVELWYVDQLGIRADLSEEGISGPQQQ